MKNTVLVLGAALLAGVTMAAGLNIGADLTIDNEFHTERFEAVMIDGEGFYGEPIDEYGQRIAGEGIYLLEVDMIPIEVNEGDIVSMSWTNAQVEYSDWSTPAKIELEEEAK